MFRAIAVAAIATLSTNVEAVQIKAQNKAKVDQAVQNYIAAESGSQTEWGFLKNIVNIDRFFDSGVKA